MWAPRPEVQLSPADTLSINRPALRWTASVKELFQIALGHRGQLIGVPEDLLMVVEIPPAAHDLAGPPVVPEPDQQ